MQYPVPKVARDQDIVLVMLPPWDVLLPPINLAYLTSHLRQQGFKATALDLNILIFAHLDQHEARRLWDMDTPNHTTTVELARSMLGHARQPLLDTLLAVIEAQPLCVGFSVHTRNIVITEMVRGMLRDLAPDLPVLYGGPQVAAALACGTADQLSADAMVAGDGEHTLVEALRALRQGRSGAPIPGLMWRNTDGFTALEPRPPIRDLDTLPFPDYSDLPLSLYSASHMLPFMFSRGCVCRCSYCEDTGLAGRFRMRSARSAVDELQLIKERYGRTTVQFNDLLCNGNLRRLEALCDEMIERDLGIRWHSYAIIRKGMTRRLLEKVKRSGCLGLTFGLESGSDHVLRLMNKKYDAAIASDVLRMCSEVGLVANVNIIVGFPGETDEHHQETLRFIAANAAHIGNIQNLGALSISPGSTVHRNQGALGMLGDEQGDWYTEDGNTPEVRRRRVRDVLRVAQSAGLQVQIVNNLGDDESPTCAASEEGPAVELNAVCLLPQKLHHEQPRPANRKKLEVYAPGDPLQIMLRYSCAREMPRPVFRVQLVTTTANLPPTLVYGANTMYIGGPEVLAQGPGELSLLIYALNLAPGEYAISAGIFADARAEAPLAARHCCITFAVQGERCGDSLVDLPVSWSLLQPQPAQPTPRPGELAVEGWDPNHTPGLRTHDALELEVMPPPHEGPGEADAPVQLRCTITTPRCTIHETAIPLPGRDGWRLRLAYRPLRLLGGTYRLELLMTGGGPTVATRRSFHVHSENILGDGLVLCPSTWFVQPTTRERDDELPR